MAREEGFTLIEVLIGAAISVVLIVTLTLLANRFVFAAASLNTRLQTQTAADHVLDRLASDATSSWGVWVSPNKATEVDFFSEDGSHRVASWAYTYDPQTKHLTRSGEDLGTFDSFSATSVNASQLGSVDPLFAHSTFASVTYGYDAMPAATGGNGLVKVTLVAAGANRSALLASGTSPTTFTVVVNYTPSPAPTSTATPVPISQTTGTTPAPTTPGPGPTTCDNSTVGSACSYTDTATQENEAPFCDYVYNEGGTMQSGYNGNNRVSMSPAGLGALSQVTNADGSITYTFTRTAPGTVTIRYEAQYVNEGLTNDSTTHHDVCSKTLSWTPQGSTTIN